mgnify:CR=1 FL=1
MSATVRNDDIPTHELPYEDLDEEVRDLQEHVGCFFSEKTGPMSHRIKSVLNSAIIVLGKKTSKLPHFVKNPEIIKIVFFGSCINLSLYLDNFPIKWL